MFAKGLSPDAARNLALLNQIPGIKKFYLAGGSALALHFAHRYSFDLDFFSPKKFNSEQLRNHLQELGKFSLDQIAEDTLLGKLNQTKISFFTYPYPLLFPLKNFSGIKIANILDIACMKLDAISGRGTKRDFIDLYFICQKEKLTKTFKLFEKKFQKANYNLAFIQKSLVYFVDAEKDEMPKMIKRVSWKEVKKFFEEEIIKLSKKYL